MRLCRLSDRQSNLNIPELTLCVYQFIDWRDTRWFHTLGKTRISNLLICSQMLYLSSYKC